MEYLGLLHVLIEEELYHSVLLLAEYLLSQSQSDALLFFILKALQRLGYRERILSFVKNNERLLVYEEIRKIYLVTLSRTKHVPVKCGLGTEVLEVGTRGVALNKQSLSVFYEALALKETLKRKMLIKSFKCDERNVESLLVLKNDKLLSKEHFVKLLETMNDRSLRTMYMAIFTKKDCYSKVTHTVVDEYFFFSPFQAYNMGVMLYRRGEYHEIFKLATFMLENYATSFISPMILGLYYLQTKKYKDAKKSFYESIELDKTHGRSWLYLGISLSLLKERINAVTCFKTAKQHMIGSFKPTFHLAKEFAEINDSVSALFYFKHTLKMKLNKFVFFSYVAFLFKEDKTKDMAKAMATLGTFDLSKKEKNVFNILNFFLLLSKGRFEEAENTIRACETDWRYYICYGYLKHLMAKNDDAINYYSECMLECSENTNVITELIKLAYSGGTQLYDHDLVDYSVDVFDMLKIGNTYEVVL